MEYLGFWSKNKKEEKEKCKRTLGSTTTSGFSCRYQVACMISLLVLHACGFLVMICHWHGGMPGLMVDFLSLSIS